MDKTLEENMREHLKGSTEREIELAQLKEVQKSIIRSLAKGDENFKSLNETIEQIQTNTNRLVLILEGTKDQEGIVCKVHSHEKFLQRFFGAIGFVTFIGVSSIGMFVWYIIDFLRIKFTGGH